MADGYGVREIPELNLADADITTVIWATGYSFDFSMVQLPIFDGDGYPIQKRGVTNHPGLYFVGLPWLHNARSGLLSGLAQDAGHIAASIDEAALHPEPAGSPEAETCLGRGKQDPRSGRPLESPSRIAFGSSPHLSFAPER
jgi:hypothetical protein